MGEREGGPYPNAAGRSVARSPPRILTEGRLDRIFDHLPGRRGGLHLRLVALERLLEPHLLLEDVLQALVGAARVHDLAEVTDHEDDDVAPGVPHDLRVVGGADV